MKKYLLLSLLIVLNTCFAEQIKIVVPSPPGGMLDTYSRVLQKIGIEKGYNIIVVNKPGAEGAVGTLDVINENSDNTVMLSGSGFFIYKAAESESYRKNILAMTPLVQLGKTSIVIFTSKNSSKYKTWFDLEKDIKANKNINVGTHSQAAITMMVDLFGEKKGINLIPYNGEKPVILDVLNQTVDVGTATYPGVINFIDSGEIVGLAVNHGKFKNLIDLTKVGYKSTLPDFIIGTFMRPNTPKDKRDKMFSLITELSTSKEAEDYRKQNGIEKTSVSVQDVVTKYLK